MAALLPVAEALARVLASAKTPTGVEAVALRDAIGRTLARELKAKRTQPPFANSAMDGYAVRAAEAGTGARLVLVGESAAGRAFDGALGPGEAVRIFTGAPVPAGADAVLIQENASREGGALTVGEAVAPNENIRAAGIDFRQGDALLAAGTRLSPRDVALAAAASHATLDVRRKPVVAILATGDELVAPGEPVGPAQIVASNNLLVRGIVEAAGGAALDLGIARDTHASLGDAMDRAKDADVLVTLGGASVGDYDLVQDALKARGLKLDFWRIAMRPGKPLIHGRVGGQTVLGLPGNPASSFVCAVLFLRPLLRALQGDARAGDDPSEPALLAENLAPNGPRQDYIRAILGRDGDGALTVRPAGDQDSSLVGVMARADALLVRAPGAGAAKSGERVRVIRLSPLGA